MCGFPYNNRNTQARDGWLARVWIIGFLATFVGVGIGGGIATAIYRFKKSMGTIYAVCAGLLLGLLSFEIVPEALLLGDWLMFGAGFAVGVVVYEVIHRRFHQHPLIRKDPYKNHSIRTGLFLALVISLHNLPMGIVLGSSGHAEFSLAFLQAMILHTIPEGMILFMPLILAGVRFNVLFLVSIVIAVPVAIGAVIGDLIGVQNSGIMALLISSTVGMIYMVTVKEILVESVRQSSNMYGGLVACVAFLVMGAYLWWL